MKVWPKLCEPRLLNSYGASGDLPNGSAQLLHDNHAGCAIGMERPVVAYGSHGGRVRAMTPPVVEDAPHDGCSFAIKRPMVAMVKRFIE